MCNICGLPNTVPCNCSNPEPFCTPCGTDKNCPINLDASCVVYHIDGDQDSPSLLTCLSLPNGSTVESILEAIDRYICNGANLPITVEDTFTIDLTANGAANHHLRADLKVSDDAGNSVEIRPDGVYVPTFADTYKVKVDGSDTPDYLINQLDGAVDQFLTISVENINGKAVITPHIDLDGLCDAISNCKCSQFVLNLTKTLLPACPTGYDLNLAGTLCQSTQVTAATINNDIITACPQFRPEYSMHGAIIYKNGFDSDGTGKLATLGADLTAGNIINLSTADVWMSDNISGNNNGPANRAGIWNCNYNPSHGGTESLGFSVPINAPSTKTYFIGIAADNDFVLTVNGNTIVDSSLSNGAYWPEGQLAKFRYWHIYPIQLSAGINFIGLVADDYGIDAVLAAEIYDNTIAQLQAATLTPGFIADPAGYPLDQNPYSNVNLLFSTRCARQPGSTFTIGNATCPDSSWNLDVTGGNPLTPPCQGLNGDTTQWSCSKTVTAVFNGFSATLVWDRLDAAITYDVQQKLASAPSTSYVDSAGSPVINPASGTTVSLTIDNLPSSDMMFRVRPNYGTCFGPWVEV